MNMNKALQNLYHAVSGSTTTKVNISKLLVDIHYAITGVESSVKNNWSRIIDSMATNWPEGGGGGSSDFSTAQVTVINNSALGTSGFHIPNICEANELGEGSPAMIYNMMICASGESTHLVRMYKGLLYCTDVGFPPSATVSTTGDIVIDGDTVSITGDCTITIS